MVVSNYTAVMALFQKVDCVLVRVPSLDEGLSFYRDALGHELLWRGEDAAAAALPGSDSELVLSTTLDPQTDLLVASVDEAVDVMQRAGGRVEAGPSDTPVGRVAVALDPFGNRLTLVDLTRGRYVTDASGRVTGVRKG